MRPSAAGRRRSTEAAGTGLLTVTGGTATFNGAVTTGALTQTGGELNGSGTLTVTGRSSSLTGGTESGSGTTIVQGGVSFGNGSPGPCFGLDGGRTLQLGGTSTATGRHGASYDQPERDQSEHRAERCRLGHADDRRAGRRSTTRRRQRLDDLAATEAAATRAPRAAVNNLGTFTKSGAATTSTICHAVQQHRHGRRRERDAEPVAAAAPMSGRPTRAPARSISAAARGRWTLHRASRATRPFSGGPDDGQRRHRHRVTDGHRWHCDLQLAR